MLLGEQLIQEGILSSQAVAAGLKQQVLHGARLGSNLVELYLLSLDDLALALGRQHGTWGAVGEHFERLDGALARQLPPDLAQELSTVPLAYTQESEPKIAVATTDPLSSEQHHRLEEILERPVLVGIAPELRVLYWLERLYGIPRLNRYKRVEARTNRDKSHSERRRYIQTLSDTSPETTKGTNQVGRVAVTKVALPIVGEVPVSSTTQSLSDFLRAIRQATGRDAVGDLALGALSQCFDDVFSAAILLTVRKEVIVGWKGVGECDDLADVVDQIALPLDEPSVFVVPRTDNEHLVTDTSTATPLDERLWQLLNERPRFVTVFPIVVEERNAGFIYLQSQEHPTTAHVKDLEDLSHALGAAFVRLIRAASR